MANVSRINGLQAVKFDQRKVYKFYHAAGTAVTADLTVGDPVTFGGTADAAGVASVAIATAGDGNVILGVVTGVEYRPAYPDRVNWIGGAEAGYVYVCVDPQAIYEAQADAAVAITAVGNNANLAVTTVPGATTTEITGTSGWSVEGASVTTGQGAYQVKIIGFPQRSDNTVNATYNKVLVMINNSLMKGGTGSVGV